MTSRTMNPEFLRYCWTELTHVRLILLAFVLGIYLLVMGRDGAMAQGIADSAPVLAFILFYFIATYHVATAAVSDVTLKTWDIQLMSPISAWRLASGKIFGSAIYFWLCTLSLAVLYILACLDLGKDAGAVMKSVALFLVCGFFGHLVAFLVGLRLAKSGRSGILLAFFIGFNVGNSAFGACRYSMLGGKAIPRIRMPETVEWHGVAMSVDLFITLSLAFFMLWCVIGIHRTMQERLQYRRMPGMMIGFVATLILYQTGLVGSVILRDHQHLHALKLLTALGILLAAAYVSGFASAGDLMGYKRLLARIEEKDPREIYRALPFWLVAGAGALCLLPIIFLRSHFSLPSLGLATGMILLVVRDVTFFHVASIRAGERNATILIVVFLAMNYGFLPLLFGP